MTKDKFITIQTKRGYQVEDLGKIVTLTAPHKGGGTYKAIWFFNTDGTPDEAQEPYWTIERQ